MDRQVNLTDKGVIAMDSTSLKLADFWFFTEYE